jgi:hypothetical protein
MVRLQLLSKDDDCDLFFFHTSSNKIVLGKGNIVDAAGGYVKFAKEKGYKKTEVGYGIKVKDKN